MPAADNIEQLDSAAFARIKENARNSKALKLIQDDAAKDSHVIAERQRERLNFLNNSKSLAGDTFDAMENGYTSSPKQGNLSNLNEEIGQQGQQYDQMLNERLENLKKSANKQLMQGSMGLMQQNPILQDTTPPASSFLPKEIIESFSKNPIDESIIENNNQTVQTPVTKKSQSIYNEQKTKSNVDYSLIQKIVESTVKKYISALNKKIISESKLHNVSNISELKAMKIGKQFSFITEDGSIYKAELKYVGNVKKKK